MDLEAKVWGGYLIRCNQGHSFIAENPRETIECPNCGQTELASELRVTLALNRLRDGGLDSSGSLGSSPQLKDRP